MTGVIHGGARLDPFQWLVKGITVQATLAYPKTLWPRVLAMIASGKFPVEKLIDATIKADEIIEKGFLRLLDPDSSAMKILVRS
ncbi:hypothetical protein [Mesorhizobium escarrei]|uniref:Zinc-binding dehydrogenase n=1 Tax=Mesorhizobium escarrei TaxID=666018 RepID=A0ABM9EFJ2_9HYPH|nr:hypothetical protein [Mesorhizobium escarrei]CAH2408118.1 hypothetical protein MES5069_650058 [Mesorhizobium escarrei]